MADLHSDFDQEQDLGSSFDKETDLHSSFDAEPTAQASDAQLMQALGNFDDMQKLSPEDQKRAQEMVHNGLRKDASENSEALLRGASQGATLGFQPELSGMAEKGIASAADALGLQDQATTDLYNNKSADDLTNTYRQQNQEAAQKAPMAYITGNVLGSLPLSIASSGLVTQGAKLAGGAMGLNGLAQTGLTAAGNVANNAVLSGASGYGNSEGTPEQRMQAAKEAAKTGALFSTAAEGLGFVASPQGQNLLRQGSDKVRAMAERAAAKSLGLTPAQLVKLDAKDQTASLGRQLLDKEVVTPFASAQSKADKLNSLKNEVGSSINKTAQELDQTANNALSQADNNEERRKLLESILSKKRFANSVEARTLNPLEEIGDPNNLGFRTKELLSKIEQSGPKQAGEELLDNSAGFKSSGAAAPTPAVMGPDNAEMEQFIANLDRKVVNGERVSLTSPEDKAMIEKLMNKQAGTSAPAASSIPDEMQNFRTETPDNMISAPDNDVLSFEKLNKMKQATRQGINYNTDSGAAATNVKNFTREMNDELLNKAQQLGEVTGRGDLADKLISANKNYGSVSTGAKAAAGNAAKKELAKTAGMIGAGSGLGYAIEGKKGAIKGAILGAGGKLASTYGRNVEAVGLDKLANVLKSAPEKLGTYAPLLTNAAQRGSASLAAANFVLQQRSPEFRDLSQNLEDESLAPELNQEQ